MEILEDDKYIIENNNVNFNDLNRNIQILSENSNIDINDISKYSNLQKAFDSIKYALNLYQNTDKYHIISDIIKKQYRPTIIIPGTIGSFIFGCFQNSYGDIDKICSILCINNIPSDEILNNLCKYQIWIPSNNLDSKYKLINISNNNHAYIFVDSNFISFDNIDIELFKNHGVEYAQILITYKYKHRILIKMTSVNNLPIKLHQNNIINKSKNYKNKYFFKYSSYFYIYFVFFIIILLFFIIFIYRAR